MNSFEEKLSLTQKELYPRTEEEFSLNEICYIMEKLMDQVSIDRIAKLTARAPWLIRFKFLEYRPLKKDGTFDFSKSVGTAEEVHTYEPQKYKEILKINKEAYYELTGQVFEEGGIEDQEAAE